MQNLVALNTADVNTCILYRSLAFQLLGLLVGAIYEVLVVHWRSLLDMCAIWCLSGMALRLHGMHSEMTKHFPRAVD